MFVYGSLFTLCGQQFSMWFTCCSFIKYFPIWPTLPDLDIFPPPVYLNSYKSVFSYHSLWLLLGLRFLLSCPKGQDTLVSFLLLPVVHEQVNMLNFSQQFERFEKFPSSRHLYCHSNMSWCQSVIWYAPTILHI